jgi:hypothetical protein
MAARESHTVATQSYLFIILRPDVCYCQVNPKKLKLVFFNIEEFSPYRKKTQHFTITKVNWLTLFEEIIAVYSENHTKHISTK